MSVLISGEKPGDRAAMERVKKRMTDSGVPPKVADREARESMIRVDRKKREEGQR